MKLFKCTEGASKYQTEPLAASGIGRFQVYKTGGLEKRPKWAVYDLYGNVTTARAEMNTLAEVKEWITRRLA